MKITTTLPIFLAAAGLVTTSFAAPSVTRLNPPSALFTYGDATPPYISRFVPGQRFDLQATIQADAGQTITTAVFKVGGTTVPGTVIVTSIGSDRYNVVLRAYSNVVAGVKTVTVEATQSNALVATASGNFEIVGITTVGRKAKNIIYLIGDGMSMAHRTAARIVSKGIALGKAIDPLAMDTDRKRHV